MTQEENIRNITTFLFNCRLDDSTFDDDTYEHLDAAEDLIKEYGWKTVFPFWFDYLKYKCPTPDEVINFAHLFFYYGGADYPLADPYPFVSYLYYCVDTAKYGGEATDIFDSIVIPMLSRIGDISLEKQPDYVPEKDPKVLDAVERWKASSAQT